MLNSYQKPDEKTQSYLVAYCLNLHAHSHMEFGMTKGCISTHFTTMKKLFKSSYMQGNFKKKILNCVLKLSKISTGPWSSLVYFHVVVSFLNILLQPHTAVAFILMFISSQLITVFCLNHKDHTASVQLMSCMTYWIQR